jgi:O-antigen/teichoic acid export membrane protein
MALMADIGTVLNEDKPAVTPVTTRGVGPNGWKLCEIVVDVATLGTGTLLAAVFNVALVFIVPKLISVEDYGYWRMFMLYAGYVGFLHLGFADGALLRWAGRPLEEFHHEIGPAMKYLFWHHLAVLVLACLFAALLLTGPLRFVAIAIAIFTPLYNITATLQFGLQGARIFRPVAISAIAAPALFASLVLLWASLRHSDFREVISLFLVSWCVPLIFLLGWTKPSFGTQNERTAKGLARGCLVSGWPILMTNTGVGLIQYADRLVVSWAASIQNFAQYSMAASAMAVPITAIQACSKVLFPHLAGVTAEGRKRIYGIASWVLLTAWIVLLPYYFVLDWLIRRYLPRYTPSVDYSRILLLGIPFMAVIQILQMSYAYLNGVQRHFLARTVAVLAVSLGLASFAAFHSGSLRIVAGTQVVILGAWWLFNEWTLRKWTGQRTVDWARFAGLYVLVVAGYWLTTAPGNSVAASVTVYYFIVALIMGVICRGEWKLLLSGLVGRHDAVSEG